MDDDMFPDTGEFEDCAVETCPDCDGTGRQRVYVPGRRFVYEACETCDGEGDLLCPL